MSVGLRVDTVVDLLGAPSFVDAFFATVSGRLEPEGWGTRFPVTMGPFYDGSLTTDQAGHVCEELKIIRGELSRFSPSQVIWSRTDPSARPPWGNDISADITSLANYFVTMLGKDMFSVLDDALSFAADSGYSAELVSVGVTVGDGSSIGIIPDAPRPFGSQPPAEGET